MPRIKGTPNRITIELREKIQAILESEFENIEQRLNELSTKDRLEITLRLMKFAIPQLKEVQLIETPEPIREIKVNIIKPNE